MSDDFRQLAAALLPSVVAAGARTMAHLRSGANVETKTDGSPVTIADREAEEILLAALATVAPDIPVVAEEASAAGNIPQVRDRFFLVDPLDGTREFIAGRDEFTVNIGLVLGGAPKFGIVYAPALSKIYLTLGEQTAVSADLAPDQNQCGLEDLNTKVLSTRSVPAGRLMTIVASRSHGSKALEAWLLGVPVAGRLNIGSSLKFCLIAQGDADIYPRFGPTKEWDTAAGHAIASASGGVVTLSDGRTPLSYGKVNDQFLNPNFIVWAKPDNPLRDRN